MDRQTDKQTDRQTNRETNKKHATDESGHYDVMQNATGEDDVIMM